MVKDIMIDAHIVDIPIWRHSARAFNLRKDHDRLASGYDVVMQTTILPMQHNVVRSCHHIA